MPEVFRITKENLNGNAKRKGRTKANTVGLWVSSVDFRVVDSKHPDALHFDSRLELEVYKLLIKMFNLNGVERQKKIFVAEDSQYGIELSWTPDFYLPVIDKYVEVKGQWINNTTAKADKALFIWQYVTSVDVTGSEILVVGDSDFDISKIKVHDYRSLPHLLA